MYIVAIAWIYVVLMMSITETSIVAGVMTFALYGILPLTIVLYIMGTSQRKRRRLALAEIAAARDCESRRPAENMAERHADSRAPGENTATRLATDSATIAANAAANPAGSVSGSAAKNAAEPGADVLFNPDH